MTGVASDDNQGTISTLWGLVLLYYYLIQYYKFSYHSIIMFLFIYVKIENTFAIEVLDDFVLSSLLIIIKFKSYVISYLILYYT